MNFYYAFETFWGIFELVNVVAVSVISLLLIYILRKHKKDRAPIFVFALNLKKSTNQIYLLIIATLLFIAVFSMYILGEIFSILYVVFAAQIIGLVSYLLVSYVILLWFKAFLRFI
ncbi:hypothetical protein M1384_01410 [Candidatus Parvarchaeota archaeon]|jgi:hypothetical protein|nr:hypothetical protein [Candidatus Parvarchaeota archaeon]